MGPNGGRILLTRTARWGIGLVAASLILLPALWVEPLNVFQTVLGTASFEAEESLRPTFFYGTGPAVPLPVALSGGIALSPQPTGAGWAGAGGNLATADAGRAGVARRPAGFWPGGFLFLTAISFAPKKI